MEELDYKKEIEPLISPEKPKTDAEIKEAFLEAYKKLTMEYGCDFFQPPPQIIRISFTKPE